MIGGSAWTRRLLAAGIFGLVFLTVPLLIVIPMSFSLGKALTFPPPGFSLRWYETFFGDPRWMDAMWTSTFVAVVSSVGSLLLGGWPPMAATRHVPRPRLGGGQLHGTADRADHHLGDRLHLALAKTGLLGSHGRAAAGAHGAAHPRRHDGDGCRHPRLGPAH